MPAVAGQTLLAPLPADALQALQHRKVVLQGEWQTGQTMYLDNRQMRAKPGFYVLTPLRLTDPVPAGQPQTVVVQRGWVPRNFEDRNALPQVATPTGVVQVQGRIAGQPARLLELHAPAAEPGVSRIRQNLDIESLTRDTGLALLPMSVLQTGASPEGLLREWPRFESAAHKHHAYAAQWFAMSAVAAGLYAWFQLISPRRRRTLHGQDPR